MTSDSSPTLPRPLLRSTSDTRIAGVAGGIGQYFAIDPVLVRVGFAVTALLSGAGLLAYLVLWAVLPRDDQAASRAGAAGA